MEKLIITDNQSVLATTVAATLSGAITTANGSMRTRTVDAADFAAHVAARILACEAGLAMETGASVPASYKYPAYAATAGCAWRAITYRGTTHYVARISADCVRANGNTRWAFEGGERVWTGLGVVLGLSRGKLRVAELAKEDTRANLERVIVGLVVADAQTCEVAEIVAALTQQRVAA